MRTRIAPLAGLAVAAALAASLAVGGSPAAGAANMAAVRAAAIDWSLDQNGMRERGATNCGPQINRWVRQMGLQPCRPWCGAFVHQAFLRAGVQLSHRLIHPHLTYDDVVAGRRGLRRVAVGRVRPGDLLLYAFRPRLKASHLALVVTKPRNGWVTTAEGNVGHEAVVKRRALRFPVLAARVVGSAA